jgi:hypothetical protein
VACAAQRVITLRDGKIQHDVAVTSESERSLLDFKSSALGQSEGAVSARGAHRPSTHERPITTTVWDLTLSGAPSRLY